MKITIITQDDPFYLPGNIDFLITNLPSSAKIVSCIVLKVSPFGKKLSTVEKVKESIRIFGWRFFLYYSLRMIVAKTSRDISLISVLKKNDIPVVHLENGINHAKSIEVIKSYNPDLLVSIAGNQIFKKPIINLAKKGCINLHTALLPKYRGLMPSFWVLKNNEEYTGVSVFYVDEGIDSGPIIVQTEIKIENMSQAELIKKTKHLGMVAIIEAINNIMSNEVELIPNPDEEMTYYSFPTRDDVKVFKSIGKKFF